MGEFAGIPPYGGGGLPIRKTADTSAWALPAVESASKSRGPEARLSSGDTGARSGGDKRRDPAAPGSAGAKLDAHTLTGPSPAFQATILELDRELRLSIARIEAAHGRDEARAAIAVAAKDRETAADTTPPAKKPETEEATAPTTVETEAPAPPPDV